VRVMVRPGPSARALASRRHLSAALAEAAAQLPSASCSRTGQAGADHKDEREHASESVCSRSSVIYKCCMRAPSSRDLDWAASMRASMWTGNWPSPGARRRREEGGRCSGGRFARAEATGLRIVGVADDAQGWCPSSLISAKCRTVRKRTRERLQHDHARGCRLLRQPGALRCRSDAMEAGVRPACSWRCSVLARAASSRSRADR